MSAATDHTAGKSEWNGFLKALARIGLDGGTAIRTRKVHHRQKDTATIQNSTDTQPHAHTHEQELDELLDRVWHDRDGATKERVRTYWQSTIAKVVGVLGARKIAFSEIRLGDKIGAGGFAEVFRATWRGDSVAVKRLPRGTEGALVDDVREEFEKEVAVMARLASSRLVRLLGYCLDPVCLVMELMSRGNLCALLHSAVGARLGWGVRLQIAEDIANGLTFLHTERVVHRDVKSLNVLLDEHLRAKLADFGIAKVISTIATSTGRMFVGSLQWSAPETFGL
jgi:serine/threonine protein kinase